MSGRLALAGTSSPTPLAEGLPGIFQPVLTRAEAALLRELARDGERTSAATDDTVAAAHAKLGLEDASPDAAARRASEDDFLWRLCAGFDELLAPIVLTLDGLDAVLDPRLTPVDFLGWLGGWVALTDGTDWPEQGWRSLIADAADLYRARGTLAAVRRTLELYTGGDVSVHDTGGCIDGAHGVASAGPPMLTIRIAGARRSPSSDAAFRRGVEAVIHIVKPMHVPYRLEWVP